METDMATTSLTTEIEVRADLEEMTRLQGLKQRLTPKPSYLVLVACASCLTVFSVTGIMAGCYVVGGDDDMLRPTIGALMTAVGLGVVLLSLFLWRLFEVIDALVGVTTPIVDKQLATLFQRRTATRPTREVIPSVQ